MRCLSSIACLVGLASAQCARQFLKDATDKYVAAQAAGDPSAVMTLAARNVTYKENEHLTSLELGVLSQPINLDFDRSLYDEVQCASITELMAASNAHPYVIHTRMVFTGRQPKATVIESIVTDKGDWLFNATGTLAFNEPEAWDPIPKERQDTREALQAVGDAYFDRFNNSRVKVPWGPPCYRLEGGTLARGNLSSGQCDMAWPSNITIPSSDRRYVIDQDMGVANLFIGFPGLDRTQGTDPMPDSHIFRVEGGKIKYLHTASSCVVEGCGLNRTLGSRPLRVRKSW